MKMHLSVCYDFDILLENCLYLLLEGGVIWHDFLKEKFYIRNSLFYRILNAFSIVRKHCITDNFISVLCRFFFLALFLLKGNVMIVFACLYAGHFPDYYVIMWDFCI